MTRQNMLPNLNIYEVGQTLKMFLESLGVTRTFDLSDYFGKIIMKDGFGVEIINEDEFVFDDDFLE